MDAKQFDEIKAKHGPRCAAFDMPDGSVAVLRPPKRAEWARFQMQSLEPAKRTAAFETLVKSCVVHPSLEQFDALIDEYPAVVLMLVDECGALAGGGSKAQRRDF